MTTPRANMLSVFRNQVPEWIPVIGMVDNYQAAMGLGADQDFNLNIVSFSRALGLDILERYDECRYEKMNEARAYELPVVTEHVRDVETSTWQDGELYYREWNTALGTLRSCMRKVNYAADGGTEVATEFPIEYPIKTLHDLRVFRLIHQNTDYALSENGVTGMNARMDEIGDDGILTMAAPSSPLGMAVRYYIGIEFLTELYFSHQVELKETLDVVGESFLRKLRLQCQTATDGVISFDDTTTRAISPRMFADMERGYIDRAADICHDYGKIYIHHSCGHINNLLDLYRSTKMDAVDMLTIEPLGDCNLREARKKLGEDIVMMPGFETLTMMNGTRDELGSMISRFFNDAVPGHNIIPILTPQPGVDDPGRWRFVADEARKYQYHIG